MACRPPPPTPSRRCRRRRPSLARQLSTVGCAMSRRPASPHGCSVHSAGLGLRTRPLGGRRRLPAIADSPSGIGEPGGARAPRARAPYPRGRSFRANICDFLAPAPPHAIPRLRGLPSTKLLLQQDALHDRPGTAGAAPPGCVSTRRRPLRGGPSTHTRLTWALDLPRTPAAAAASAGHGLQFRHLVRRCVLSLLDGCWGQTRYAGGPTQAQLRGCLSFSWPSRPGGCALTW